MPRAVFDALVDQAHSRRLPVAVHLFYLDDAKYMLEADADLIAHSIRDLPVDDEFIDAVSAKGVCYIPTLTREISTFVYESVPEFFSDPYFLKEADPAVLEALQTPRECLVWPQAGQHKPIRLALRWRWAMSGHFTRQRFPLRWEQIPGRLRDFRGTLSISSFSSWLMPA